MANIAIITGGSKGIGLALADKYLENNYQVFSIARSKIAKKNNLHNYSCDLSDPIAGVNTLQEILKQIDFNSLTSIVLINNAGSLGDISNIENNTAISIEKNNCLKPKYSPSFNEQFHKRIKRNEV
jgi:benzil reductase ((S)-benzoin forming)